MREQQKNSILFWGFLPAACPGAQGRASSSASDWLGCLFGNAVAAAASCAFAGLRGRKIGGIGRRSILPGEKEEEEWDKKIKLIWAISMFVGAFLVFFVTKIDTSILY